VFATEQFGFECAEERLAHRVVNFNAAFHERQLTSPSIKEFRRITKLAKHRGFRRLGRGYR
jgi:hypothetical protein